MTPTISRPSCLRSGRPAASATRVPQPNRHLLLAGSVTHQRSETTTISIRPSYEDLTNTNRGVGGVTLASAGTNFEHREEQVTYTQQTILRPTLLNQFQMLVGHEREPTTSASSARGIVVAGAFTGGGAQSDLLRTEHHFQMNESLTWTNGHNLVQAGFQVPDWSRRRFDDRTNAGGTFYFSDLQAYAAGRPYAFIQQQGNGHVVLLEKILGLYVKDDWQVRPGLSMSLGLRYDWQNYFHDNNNLAPRFSMAYAPGDGKTTVIRGGAGMFYDRTGPVSIADVLHSQPGGLRRVVLTDPGYPDPFQAAAGIQAQPPSIVQFAPNLQIPYTWQYSLGVDHQLQKTTTLSLTYTGSRGYHLFRSRDVNAPRAPLYGAAGCGVRRRPADRIGRPPAERCPAGHAAGEGDALVQRPDAVHAEPDLQRHRRRCRGFRQTTTTSRESGRAPTSIRRHRFLVLGRVNPGRFVDLGVG